MLIEVLLGTIDPEDRELLRARPGMCSCLCCNRRWRSPDVRSRRICDACHARLAHARAEGARRTKATARDDD